MLSSLAKPWIHLCTILVLLSLAGCGAAWKAPLETRGDSAARHSARVGSAETIRGRSYRVRRGDTLYSIAWRAGKDFRSLARLNGIRPPYTIYPGQLIRLHSATRQPQTPAKPQVQAKPRSATAATPEERPATRTRPATRSAPASAALRWQWPANGPVLSSYSAKDPSRKGIKIGGSAGQAVVAAEAGRVVYSGSGLIGYGQLIIIKHNDNYLSAYGHNAKLLVKEGETVVRGTRIADMGRSNDGRAMLHFEIRRDGHPIDPMTMLPRR